MKANITRGSGFRGLINYVMDQGPKATGDKRPEWIGGTMGGEDARELAAEIAQVRTLRPDIKRPIWHCSLSLPHGERLDADKWREVAEDFMKRLDFAENTPWVAVRHSDKEHDHIHIVASRISTTGEIWLGKFEAKNAIAICQQMEISHGLQRTKGLERSPAADKRPKDKELRKAERTGEEPARERLKVAIFRAVSNKPTMEEYEKQLQAEGITPFPNIASTGRMNGYAYEIDGIRFKGSQLGRDYSWSALQKRGLQYDGLGTSSQGPNRNDGESIADRISAEREKAKPGKSEQTSHAVVAMAEKLHSMIPGNTDKDANTTSNIETANKSKARKKEEARKARSSSLYQYELEP